MGQTFTFPNTRVLLEIYSLLRDIDPSRWRDDLEAAMRARLSRVQEGVAQLAASVRDERLSAARAKLEEMSRLLRDCAPSYRLPDSSAIKAEWLAFRARVAPAYEAVAVSLRAQAIDVPSLRPTNYARTLFHVASAVGSLLLLEMVLPLRSLPWITGGFALVCWTLEITRRRSAWWNDRLLEFAFFKRIVHPRERHQVNSSTWYATALFVLALLRAPTIAVVALAVLGLADPAAAVVGRRWGRTRIARNRSLQGSLAFFFTGVIAAWAALLAFHPAAGLGGSLAIAAGATLAGTTAELLSTRLDDNFTVPLAAALGAWLMGWSLGLDLLF